jgi:hypothetical protein
MKLSESIKSNFKDFGLTEEESKIPGIDKKFDYEKQTIDKLNRSEKFDEIDTVAFGLETDDRKIVKVYVNAENADAFEEALSRMLGEKDDIEEILNDLSKDFDIVDVDWPEQDQEENTEDEQQEDGSEIMDKKVYKNDEVKETLGDQLAQKIFESGNTIETRFSSMSSFSPSIRERASSKASAFSAFTYTLTILRSSVSNPKATVSISSNFSDLFSLSIVCFS